jgi:hypothetical protein
MRTTLRIDDDVFEVAKSLAMAERKTVGEVISELARRGLAPRTCDDDRDGFPVFEVRPDAPPLTLEKVRQALDEP